MNRLLLAACLLLPAFSGCIASEWDIPLTDTEFALPAQTAGPLSAHDIEWPDFGNETLRLLDHGAFWSCEDAGALFTQLTGANVSCNSADDTGSALHRAIAGKGDPEFDVLYGVDNFLLHQAVAAGLFQPYTPQLAARVPAEFLFFNDTHDDHEHTWPATPVDHGYIGLNIDHAAAGLAGAGFNGTDARIENLFDVRTYADQFVTQDPRTSTPGLGFFLITVRTFGENDTYDWQDYWNELLDGGAKITSGWSEAYETHFSGGYGTGTPGHLGDRAIVTSYTQSPAVEVYFATFNDISEAADVMLNHGFAPATIHQIQTMAILEGTPNRAIAEAWIEFTLTDEFQAMAASYNAVYPVVDTVDANDVYGENDPEPGTFDTVDFDFLDHGDDVERWVHEWVDLFETHQGTPQETGTPESADAPGAPLLLLLAALAGIVIARRK